MMRERCGSLIAGCDLAVAVPLHPSKRRARGFNQAEDLARPLGLPLARALRRRRRTEAQADLSAERRIENVRAAFTPGRDYRRIIGRTVLLVDDVTTTGATLHECATALRAGGAADVWAVTAARAVTRWR